MKDRGRSPARRQQLGLGIFLVILTLAPLKGQDVFQTEKNVPPTQASPFFNVPAANGILGGTRQPLTLPDAVECAFYNNPQTRQAWADIKAQAAGVGQAYSAYLPTLNGSIQGARQVASTDVNNFPELSSTTWANTNEESVALSWVLYDFGGRHAALQNARDLLAAAQASHEKTLRQVFEAVTKDYYAAQAAQGAMTTAMQNEDTAKESYTAAKERVDHGVSPISDELQAQTAYLQDVVSVTQARGDWLSAEGTLNVDMGLRPDMPMSLPDVDVGVLPDKDFKDSATTLINLAVARHPTVREAEAQLAAAEAKVKYVRSQILPNVSLVAKSTRSDQPLNEEVGVSSFKATETESYVGAQISVPLFDGFSNDYQVRQARAQVEAARYAVEQARQQVELDVWTTYQTLQESADNLSNQAALLDMAKQSYTAAQQRYEKGVGTIIERLDAQSALANARLGWVKAWTDWRNSRLQLYSKLGTMGTWWLNPR